MHNMITGLPNCLYVVVVSTLGLADIAVVFYILLPNMLYKLNEDKHLMKTNTTILTIDELSL